MPTSVERLPRVTLRLTSLQTIRIRACVGETGITFRTRPMEMTFRHWPHRQLGTLAGPNCLKDLSLARRLLGLHIVATHLAESQPGRWRCEMRGLWTWVIRYPSPPHQQVRKERILWCGRMSGPVE